MAPLSSLVTLIVLQGFTMKRYLPHLFTLLILAPVAYHFLSGYFAAASGKNSSALVGEWVGTVNVQLLSDTPEPPRERYGNAVMRITFKPVFFSFLTKLGAQGEVTGDTGKTKTFKLEPFLQPFDKAQGTIQARSSGGSDDSMTGVWEHVSFTQDNITLQRVTGGERYLITGMLHKGDDAKYDSLVKEMKQLGSTFDKQK
jgi:hypothetical protein